MIVETDPAQTPFGIFVRLGRQRLQRRAVELEEQIAAADGSRCRYSSHRSISVTPGRRSS